jgi:hypothetical protein
MRIFGVPASRQKIAAEKIVAAANL